MHEKDKFTPEMYEALAWRFPVSAPEGTGDGDVPAVFAEFIRMEAPNAQPALAWSIRKDQHAFWLRVQRALDAAESAKFAG